MSDIQQHDKRTIRCRRLGHEVTFHYCRTQEGRTVCVRILDCWWEVFDVRGFLQEHLPPQEFAELTHKKPGRGKVHTLLELIERAKASQPRDEAGEPSAD